MISTWRYSKCFECSLISLTAHLNDFQQFMRQFGVYRILNVYAILTRRTVKTSRLTHNMTLQTIILKAYIPFPHISAEILTPTRASLTLL